MDLELTPKIKCFQFKPSRAPWRKERSDPTRHSMREIFYDNHLLFRFTLNYSSLDVKMKGGLTSMCVVVYCDHYRITTPKNALQLALLQQIKCLLKINLYSSIGKLAFTFNLSCASHKQAVALERKMVL